MTIQCDGRLYRVAVSASICRMNSTSNYFLTFVAHGSSGAYLEFNSTLISVHFLDVTITNENGRLRTSMYHKRTAQSYILPYTSDHPRHIHRNRPYAKLLRVARVCSDVNDFNLECLRLDISLLLNNYPPHFVIEQFNRFFKLNNAMPIWRESNEQVHAQLHQNLLYQPTRREKRLQIMMQDFVRAPAVLQPKIWNRQLMFPRYLFDLELKTTFQKRFKKWWKTYFAFSGSLVQ